MRTLPRLLPVAALPVTLVALMASGCAPMTTKAPTATASAQLLARSGSQVSGNMRFEQMGDHVMVRAEIGGLNPGQEHGFHIHEKGDCSAADATSAGGHYNPTAKPHGPQHSDHHAGDMPSLKADSSGVARVNFALKGVTLTPGATSLMGRSVIVHKDPDDYKTQPTGNSGARWACGVIG